MLGIGAALASIGISFVKDMITEHGEDLVKKGIEKVTGVDLNTTKPVDLLPNQVEAIKEAELKIKALDFEKIQLEFEQEKEANRHEELKYTTAHNTYVNKNEMADTIAKQIISRNLPIIAALVIMNIGLVYYMQEHASLIAIASNIIGVAIGNLFNERQAIVNFFFGSSIGSKEKSKQLETKK